MYGERGIIHQPGPEGNIASPDAYTPFPRFEPKRPLPLSEIPLWHERFVDSDTVFVARHEMAHAFVALEEGVAVKEVSVIPNPAEGYRGLTTLAYVPEDVSKLQRIAAAGSYYSPEGNGSDRKAIKSLEKEGGKNEEASFATAFSICDRLSSLEWDMVASIVAHKKKVQGSELPSIIERAKIEAQMYLEMNEQNQGRYNIHQRFQSIKLPENEQKFISDLNAHVQSVTKKIENNPDAIVIQEESAYLKRPNGTVIRFTAVNGAPNEKDLEVICTHCNQKNEHTKDCDNKDASLEVTKDMVLLFPIETTVFQA